MDSPVLGRASSAAAAEPVLRAAGDSARASWRADAGSSDRWTVRAATVAGIRHRLNGTVGEDSYAWRSDGDRLALAVADGLGSVEGSADASQRAATTAVYRALSDGPSAAIDAANQALAEGGATTLLVATVEADGAARLARVGDSTAFVLDEQGGWRELFRPHDDDRVGTETAALPSEDPEIEEVDHWLLQSDVLLLASDGLADPWRDGPTTVAPALVAALRRPTPPLELARLADFSRQGCHDDRTVLGLWRR